MALLKSDPSPPPPTLHDADTSPLGCVMREFEHLVLGLETGMLRSLEDPSKDDAPNPKPCRRDDIRQEACRLAIAELSNKYTRKQIRHSLHAAELQGKRVEEQLLANVDSAAPAAEGDELRDIHNGYFRLYSTELFDMLGQPTDLRFGTLRFHHHADNPACRFDPAHPPEPSWISVELALGSSFFVADSHETLPYHAFKMPQAPCLQNRGILSRRPDDNGLFPDFDSWLLFTFLGNGCLKLEVPVEMCADIYGDPLRGRENEEVHFWGVFVDDEAS